MRRIAAALLLVLLCTATAGAAQPSQTVTAAELKAAFKKTTGDKLVVNRAMSYAGHYTAFDAGVVTIARKAKYGTFTIYLVTGPDVDADVEDLLADSRTGMLGTPGAASIYWEAGTTIHGDRFWLAKKRYGSNVVLWWIGNAYAKKTDRTFKRLHAALLLATK